MTDRDGKTAWFLAQLKPNSYRIAERNLQRQGFRTFLPLQEATLRRHGKFQLTLKPLFPGYLFVAVDTSSGGWRAINSTHGVTKLVNFGDDPAPVPMDLVSELMLRCDSEGKLLPPQRLTPGDSVTLTYGPFADFAAKVEQIDSDQRVWVLLDLMGRKTRLAVDADVVRPL